MASSPVPTLIAEPYNLPMGFGWPRMHGQLNLNMIRHPQVLAALLDDDLLINGSSNLLMGIDDNTRLWWLEFLKARDSRFTTSPAFDVDGPTGLYVPGTANSRPFHSFDALGRLNSASSPTDSPLENTILRSLPMDSSLSPNPNEHRRLFEVGLASEHLGTPATEATGTPLHPSARYRLLSKLINNTTTRSNSFAIFLTVQYHEAVDVSDGGGAPAIRIGGRLEDAPTHRGFFVVDRTGAIEQMKRLTASPVSTNTFSFQADTARSGTPNGIRWKDLVLYRQTLN